MRILFLLLLLLPGALAAQSVRGRVLEAETGKPLQGAVVVLIDSAGAQRGGALSDARGRFLLAAPRPGAYRLRAERVGFRSTLSPPLSLAAGDTLEHDLAAPAMVVQLSGIEVTGERRCVVRPAEGMQMATLWEEARKALSAAALTEEQRLARFRVRRYDRNLDPTNLRIQSEQASSRTHTGSSPFQSLPAEDLASGGYVRAEGQEYVYYAPDAGVLLSDPFLDTHCLRVRRDEREPGRVGLAFEPVRGRSVPDIQGVLWLDERSAELRHVEFTYTRTPLREAARLGGGRVEYERLPSGAWIVRRWWIRMPVMQRDLTRNQIDVVSVREAGGEAGEIVSDAGAPPRDPGAPRLTGTVYDSVAAAPLAGATVYLSGTSWSAVTDSAGAYRLEGMGEGEYTVGFLHPRLDSLGIVAAARPVSLARGREATLDLAIPPPPAQAAPLSGPPPLPDPVPVEGVAVRAPPREERARNTAGYVVEGEELRQMSARGVRVVDLLRTRFPVDVREAGAGVCVTLRRAQGGSSRACDTLELYLDDVRIPDPGPALRGMGLEEVERIELITAAAGTMRYGARASSGVLLIRTRGR